MPKNIKIRHIQLEDNKKIASIITSSLQEMGITGPGCTTEDPELNNLYSTYQDEGSRYCVVIDEDTDTVLGGGGFSRLKGTNKEDGICELQKFYFLKDVQGLGLGKKLLTCMITRAKKAGYKEAYLETHYKMERATKLYEKYGFKRLNEPKGNTGHYQRSICMSKELN